MTTPQTIPFGRPWITDEDRQSVMAVLDGPILTHGPQGKAFEAEFAAFLGGDGHCVSTSSCMAALHMAYLALDIGPGAEVIVPAQTHIATVHGVEWVGARPVFADCDPATGNVTAAAIAAAITPQTRAVAVVHFVGIPCDMPAIVAVAEKHGLKVIEDCALAVGSRCRETHVGLLGDAGCFSFYPVKHITTGEGGMFVTRHTNLAERVQKLRAFGVDRSHGERSLPGMYDAPTLGLNYRMSELQAALGRSQLRRIQTILDRRRANFMRWREALAGVKHCRLLETSDASLRTSPYCLSLVLEGPLTERRNTIIERLNAAGIGTSIYYPLPVPQMTYYRKKYHTPVAQFPHAAALSGRSVALPVGPHLTSDEIDYMTNTCREILGEYDA